MAESNASIDRESAEFAELALNSLKESVRQALIEHERLGLLVPGLNQDQSEWISPTEKLDLYPAPKQTRTKAQATEQDAQLGF
jgi:hypothetical protein